MEHYYSGTNIMFLTLVHIGQHSWTTIQLTRYCDFSSLLLFQYQERDYSIKSIRFASAIHTQYSPDCRLNLSKDVLSLVRHIFCF